MNWFQANYPLQNTIDETFFLTLLFGLWLFYFSYIILLCKLFACRLKLKITILIWNTEFYSEFMCLVIHWITIEFQKKYVVKMHLINRVFIILIIEWNVKKKTLRIDTILTSFYEKLSAFDKMQSQFVGIESSLRLLIQFG